MKRKKKLLSVKINLVTVLMWSVFPYRFYVVPGSITWWWVLKYARTCTTKRLQMSSDMSTWLYRNQRVQFDVRPPRCNIHVSINQVEMYTRYTSHVFSLRTPRYHAWFDEKIMQTFHPNAPCKLSPLWKCNWFINVITRLAFISSRVMVTLENHIRIYIYIYMYVCRYATGIHDTYYIYINFVRIKLKY